MKTKSERRETIKRKRRAHTVHNSFPRVLRALAERVRQKREKDDQGSTQ